jgi:ferredoxin-NADP reductase
VSQWLHASARVGLILDVSAPRGDFILTDASTSVVLVSAGVGATPVLDMLHQLAAVRSSRTVWWFHAAGCPPTTPSAAKPPNLSPRSRTLTRTSATAPQQAQSLPEGSESTSQ